MKKKKIKTELTLLAIYLAGCKEYMLPYKLALEVFGAPTIKKARRREIIICDPDPHTGRTQKRVGQVIKRFLPGWGKKGVRKDTYTNTQFGKNVVPTVIILDNPGISLLERVGYKPLPPRRKPKAKIPTPPPSVRTPITKHVPVELTRWQKVME